MCIRDRNTFLLFKRMWNYGLSSNCQYKVETKLLYKRISLKSIFIIIHKHGICTSRSGRLPLNLWALSNTYVAFGFLRCVLRHCTMCIFLNHIVIWNVPMGKMNTFILLVRYNSTIPVWNKVSLKTSKYRMDEINTSAFLTV